jgi:FkbM family methyltransferase
MSKLKLYKIKSEMALRKIGNKFGVDVKMTDEEILIKQIVHNGIDMIFDIGANTGQFGEIIYRLGYKGKMVSFEPLTSAYEILVSNSKSFDGWMPAERCAVGDTDGEIEMHISENSISSSAMKMLEEHENAAPKSKYVGVEKAKVYKLDTIFDKYADGCKNILVKIDTQGFEEKIFNGSVNSMNKIKGLYLEMSLVKLYEGQILFKELYERIISSGFGMYGIQPAFVNKETGRVLQVDATFFRE